ncbi:zf-TFIIB domain-containing protein [Sphingobacterium sp. SGG-5]|uniref:TFIIB-type zinc ribbon-containing protein n=1 Tax=Sphingobacterium sp. SGG-5 TaxID=2710881 RepID=UPI001F0FF66C
MTERHSVEIDYCPGCRGVWLDKGELDKLLEFAATQNQSSGAGAQRYERREDQNASDSYDRYDDRGDRKNYPNRYPRKKKSFLSDFFDFD